MLKKHLVDFSIIIFIFLIDRVSKLLIISSPETYEQYGISITSFLNFNLIWNEGIAFGLLSFQKENLYDILSLIILFVILAIFFISIKSRGIKKLIFSINFKFFNMVNIFNIISNKFTVFLYI